MVFFAKSPPRVYSRARYETVKSTRSQGERKERRDYPFGECAVYAFGRNVECGKM